MSLVDVLLDEIVFLATAPEEDVNLDVAVARLEAVVYGIQAAPEAERRAFVGAMTQRIETEVGEARATLIGVAELLAGE
jgi:hypothetical protein